MQTKPLLYGIIGFLMGGLLVSVAATTLNKPTDDSMTAMVSSLQSKTGDAYDAEFIDQMIMHHQGAIDMAELSAKQANHKEIKELSEAIITAQEKEIANMKQWQKSWGYESKPMNASGM
jgi:uncharacterized protein (DUF305 family)